MRENNFLDIVKARRSFRTFDGKPLSDDDKERIKNFCDEVKNPYDIPIEFRFLEPKKNGLKSQVLKGETLYLGAKVKKQPFFEEAYGYSFEAVVLYAQSLGVATVWIGGTMNRESFERAMELGEDELMPCVTPLGYPADKMAVREVVMRRAVKADKRNDLSELIFDKEYGNSLKESLGEDFDIAFEAVRLAPSAVNKQPWRIIVSGDDIHFYEKPDKGYVRDETGDLQRIDIGIAMYHFCAAMENAGRSISVSAKDPGITVPDGVKYISTITLG